MRGLDLAPLFRSSVGFDRLNAVLDAAFKEASHEASYPPYNIERLSDNRYIITMAVAGFKQEELDIVMQEGVLLVKGKTIKEPNVSESQFLHRGIARRNFEQRFQLADHIRVISAELDHGLLQIELVREIPEHMKPQKIEIQSVKTIEKK